jgi:hypothetical protein
VVDLSNYLCPAGSVFPLVGVRGSSGYEICQSQRNATGYCYFVKNHHAETLWFDTNNIYRGLDTSGIEADDVYAQFTDGRYGAMWAKRNMTLGQIVQRSPDIQRYHANGQPKGTLANNIISYLKFAQQFTQHTFSTGVTVSNVVELHWTSDAAGKNILERYFYAQGRGLVGFDASPLGGYQSEIGALTASPPPTRTPFPFNEPVPPPIDVPFVPPPANKSGPTCGKLALSNVRLRTKPTLSGAIIREMPLNEVVTYYQLPVKNADGYQWVWVETRNGNGYAARFINGASTFAGC